MGKKNKHFDNIQELDEEIRALDRKRAKIAIDCPHTKKNGKLTGKHTGTKFKCARCRTEFDLEQIRMETLTDALKVVDNAINQVKIFSDAPGDVDDSRIVSTLGNLAYNLKEFPALYKRTIGEDDNGKRKKKNRNNNGDDSLYDIGSFIPGKKNNKKHKKSNW